MIRGATVCSHPQQVIKGAGLQSCVKPVCTICELTLHYITDNWSLTGSMSMHSESHHALDEAFIDRHIFLASRSSCYAAFQYLS